MLSITDLKKGTVIQLEGKPYRVVEYDHASMGRGGAVVRTKLRNLVDGSVAGKTFRGNDKIEPARIDSIGAQFLYSDDEQAHFMRTDTYEQISLPLEVINDDIEYMKEGMEITLLYHGDKPVTYELPIKLSLKVTEADPGVKGDSASNVMKGCRVETGKHVQVPLFIEAGDTIRVDTRTGTYVDRV